MDFGSAVSRAAGITAEELAALGSWRERPDLFDADDGLVLELAERMTETPAEVPQELFDRLRKRFTEAQLVELAATVAWENFVARFNRAFDIEAEGFVDGTACRLPEEGRTP